MFREWWYEQKYESRCHGSDPYDTDFSVVRNISLHARNVFRESEKRSMNLASLVRSPTSFCSLFLFVLVNLVRNFDVGVDMVGFVLDCILPHCLLLFEGLWVGFKSSTSFVEFLTILKRTRCATRFFFLVKFFTEYCMYDRIWRDCKNIIAHVQTREINKPKSKNVKQKKSG